MNDKFFKFWFGLIAALVLGGFLITGWATCKGVNYVTSGQAAQDIGTVLPKR